MNTKWEEELRPKLEVWNKQFLDNNRDKIEAMQGLLDAYWEELMPRIKDQITKAQQEIAGQIIEDIEPNLQMELEEFAWRKRIKDQLRKKYL